MVRKINRKIRKSHVKHRKHSRHRKRKSSVKHSRHRKSHVKHRKHSRHRKRKSSVKHSRHRKSSVKHSRNRKRKSSVKHSRNRKRKSSVKHSKCKSQARHVKHSRHRNHRLRVVHRFNMDVKQSSRYSFDKTEKPSLKYRATSNVKDCRSKANMCNSIGSFTPESLKILHSFVPLNDDNKNEVAGPIELIDSGKKHKYHHTTIYKITVDKSKVQGGNDKEVDAIATKYNFHSHPEAAYVAHDCELGWPSRDDYVTFLDGFFKSDTTFHVITTKEGLYILKINPCCIVKLKDYYKKLSSRDKEKFIDDVDDWADEFINISKVGLKISKGKTAPKTGELIKTPDQYVDFINNVECDKIKTNKNSLDLDMPIFDIEFIDWDDAKNATFMFTRVKQNGRCTV